MNQQTANWDHCLEHAELSDVGLRRANNQDSLAVAIASSQEQWLRRGHLFMVADGMGAHAAGELASKLAASIVPLAYDKAVDRSPHESLAQAVREANTQINSRGQANDDFRGMGTTISALALLPQGAIVAQVGDSRAYRLRKNRLEQLSFDHSLVWELRAAGKLPAADVPSYIPKNIITRSLGPNPEVQIDLEGPFPIEAGDTFLLCSDGLSGQVKDAEIGKILACLSPKDAVQALVDLANLNGGPDNITVIVVRVTGPQAAQSETASPAPAANRAPRPVHPAVWSLLGLLSLAFLGLLAVGQTILALVCLAGAGVAGVVGWMARFGPDEDSRQFDGLRLGRGPYVAADGTPDAPFVARLAEIAQQLRDVAVKEHWAVDWQQFDAHASLAVTAAQAGHADESVREYCHAVSFMMAQLRTQRGRKRPDTSPAGPF